MEKVYEDSKMITHRFICGCLHPSHSADITLELVDEGKRLFECTLNLYMYGKTPFQHRLKQLWNLLKGQDGNLADFIIRSEDITEIIKILNRVKPYSSTAGTENI